MILPDGTYVDGRKMRKKSPPRRAWPKNSKKAKVYREMMKKRMKDPEYRAKLSAGIKASHARRKARGDRYRFNVFDGMRKPEAEAAMAEARRKAKEDMAALKKAGVLDDADEKACEALEAALEVLRSPANQGTKLAAARLILDFTKSKPVAKSEVTVNAAEAWLATIHADGENEETDEGGVGEDA